MANGNQNFQTVLNSARYYITTTQNPSLVPTNGQKGCFAIYVPASGTPNVYQKQDDGVTTNWFSVGASALTSIPGYYPVFAGGPYPTIQGAINQAILDGYGGFNVCVVEIFSGTYNEDVDVSVGISLVSSSGLGAVINGRIRYQIPPGGEVPGTSVFLKGLYITQQAGKNCILVTASNPGDFGVLVAEDLGCVSFLLAEPESVIRVTGSINAVVQLTQVRGFNQSSDPAHYFIDAEGTLTLRETSMNTNVKYLRVRNTALVNYCQFYQDLGGMPVITVDNGANLICGWSLIQSMAAGPQTGVQVDAGGSFFSTHNNFAINIDAGSRCVAGTGTYAYAYDVYAFSDQVSVGLTLLTLDVVPTPV